MMVWDGGGKIISVGYKVLFRRTCFNNVLQNVHYNKYGRPDTENVYIFKTFNIK